MTLPFWPNTPDEDLEWATLTTGSLRPGRARCSCGDLATHLQNWGLVGAGKGYYQWEVWCGDDSHINNGWDNRGVKPQYIARDGEWVRASESDQ